MAKRDSNRESQTSRSGLRYEIQISNPLYRIGLVVQACLLASLHQQIIKTHQNHTQMIKHIEIGHTIGNPNLLEEE